MNSYLVIAVSAIGYAILLSANFFIAYSNEDRAVASSYFFSTVIASISVLPIYSTVRSYHLTYKITVKSNHMIVLKGIVSTGLLSLISISLIFSLKILPQIMISMVIFLIIEQASFAGIKNRQILIAAIYTRLIHPAALLMIVFTLNTIGMWDAFYILAFHLFFTLILHTMHAKYFQRRKYLDKNGKLNNIDQNLEKTEITLSDAINNIRRQILISYSTQAMNWAPFIASSVLGNLTAMVDYRIAIQFRTLGIFAFDALRTKAQYYIRIAISQSDEAMREIALHSLRKMTIIPFSISVLLFFLLLSIQLLSDSFIYKINGILQVESIDEIIKVVNISAFFTIIAIADVFFGYSGTLLNMKADNADYYKVIITINLASAILLAGVFFLGASLILVALIFALLRLILNFALWRISIRKFNMNACPFVK